MKAENVYQQFLTTAKYLLKELDYYGSNQFRTPVPKQDWTIGMFYDYLINSTLSFYIPKIEACLKTSASNTDGKKKVKGKFMFWYGRVPAIIKYKDISNYSPVQPENPAKIKDNLYRFIKVMNKMAHEIDKAANQGKVEHTELGLLSALEWYKLIEMNFKYHLKTKFELDKVVRNAIISSEDDLPDFHEEVRTVEDDEF